ncbi:enoyl-CoA hydratase/isomerase family protein [soil metagenome]
MDERGVAYEEIDGVGHIVLDRPDASNAVDLPAARAFGAAVRRAEESDAVGAILIAGNGKRFCAGGDVGSMAAADDQTAYLRELADVFDQALQHLAAVAKPVVAAVHGAVAGAGIGVMLAADLIVADRGTKFLTAYAGIGLSPDCGVSYLLPRAIGQVRALEMAIGGRVLSADEALAWGLVTAVVDEDVRAAAHARAARLASGPTFAYGEARRLIRTSWEGSRAESGADEAETIARAVGTPAAKALIDAFVNPPAR